MSAHHKDESVMRVMPAQETSVVLSSWHLCQFTLTFNHPRYGDYIHAIGGLTCTEFVPTYKNSMDAMVFAAPDSVFPAFSL